MDPRWDDEDLDVVEFTLQADEKCREVFGGFDYGDADLDEILSPPGLDSTWLSEHELEVDGVLISFSPEPPGWQVVFLAPPSAAWARQVAERILSSLTKASGQSGTVI